jgi:hypothetical protein
MKKLIALVSLCLSFGFALALANTEETMPNRESTSDSSIVNVNEETHSQGGSPGIAADSTSPSLLDPKISDSKLDPKMSDPKMSKPCIDEKGITFNPGQKGFKECVQADKT